QADRRSHRHPDDHGGTTDRFRRSDGVRRSDRFGHGDPGAGDQYAVREPPPRTFASTQPQAHAVPDGHPGERDSDADPDS
ncbi:MAG TPA: hypothetical protein VK903_09365, partial [Propionicimonas sp.]|nr:hypothetical protein [Propionicimonas sp.]